MGHQIKSNVVYEIHLSTDQQLFNTKGFINTTRIAEGRLCTLRNYTHYTKLWQTLRVFHR